MECIAFANNKGGSGKTTSCANVGYCLWTMGKKVLLIDGDMQMNLSLSYFDEDRVLEFATSGHNLYTAILEGESLEKYIVNTDYDGLDLIPSSTLMSGMEYKLFAMEDRERRLKKSMAKILKSGKYDYILIDAPPTLGGWVMNILAAVDSVILPVEASPWGLFGLANMLDFIDEAKKINKGLELLGIALTKVDIRKNYYKQTAETLKEADVPVFKTIIRIDREVEWAQDNSKPIMAYKNSARSASEYLELAKEVDKKCQ
ncbi:MAG: ParA family protein [Pseudobutyrivibrio ruminis]|nr:ParA family protein [Pseudobutyrivibrio ruminis]